MLQRWFGQVSDLDEPLGHILLKEAGIIDKKSLRSLIMIMTAALEAAIKIHIGKITPDTNWLMEKTPSPPMHKMSREYLPLLHSQPVDFKK